jgi:NAD-dependent deacetylase
VTVALADWLRRSHRILVFCGAGISTASGIPDFRSPGGVWSRRRPVYYQDFMTSEDARVEFWDLKLEIFEGYRDAEPNAVHHALVALERAEKLEALVTQNVDGLHRRAGSSPDVLVELHGTDSFAECQTCHARSPQEPHLETFRQTRRPPRCACGGFLKSATISFGQALRPADMTRAEAAAEAADLVISLGSTLSVYPAASIPLVAAARGTPYIIVNRGPSEHDDNRSVVLRLDGDVSEIVPSAVTTALRSEA